MRLHSLASAPLAALPSVALALACASMLAGCGQKGPLVMPDTDTSGVVIRPAATPPAPAAPTAAGAPASTPTPPDASSPPPDDEAAPPRSDSPPRR